MPDEPTVHELLRGLSSKVDNLSEQVRHQRTSDRELWDLRMQAVEKDIAEDRAEIAGLKARLDRMANMVWTAIIGPVIVGLILWQLTKR